ncbi:flavodoxin family protein [Patescibacteria group bacterium]
MKTAKLLLISGSPRRGNSEFVLREIAKSLPEKETEIVLLRDCNIRFCQGCYKNCFSTDKCILQDDMTTQIFPKLIGADLIIISHPLYFGNVSGQMKTLVDRTVPAFEKKLLGGKKLLSIMIGGDVTGITAGFHLNVIEGFVRFNGLDLLARHNLQAQDENDLVKSKTWREEELPKILKSIKDFT